MGYKHLKQSDVETIKSLLDKNVDFNLIEKLTGFSTWTIRRVKAGQYDFKFSNPEENQTDNSVVETLLNKIIENQNTIISMIKNKEV